MDEFEIALIEHLGPHALSGDKMTPLEAFKHGWNAAIDTAAEKFADGWYTASTARHTVKELKEQ